MDTALYYAGALSAGALGYIMGGPTGRYRVNGITYHGDGGLAGAFHWHRIYRSRMKGNKRQGGQTPTPPNTPHKKQKTYHIFDKMAPMDIERPVAPQMDHLPGGISSKTVRVSLGGREKYRGHGNMHYNYQFSASVSNASMDAGALSGNQCALVCATMMTVPEFTRKTGLAADGITGMGKNVFNLNPNQLFTGSGYTAATVPDVVGTASNTAAIVPQQDFVNWKSSRFIFDVMNMTTNPFFGTFYVCKAKRDMPQTNNDPLSCWEYADMNFRVGAVSTALPAAAPLANGEYYGNPQIVHTVPTSSLRFNTNWKVVKVIPCNMAVNGSCKVKFDIEVHRTYDREIMEKKLADSVFFAKGSIAIMFVAHGAPIWSTVAGQNSVKYGSCQVGMICTVKHNFGFVNKEKRLRVFQQWSNQTDQIPLANQRHPSNAVGGDQVYGL